MAKQNRVSPWVYVAAVVVIVLAVVGFGKFRNRSEVLKVGATPVPHVEILNVVKPLLAADGVNLQIVEFTDYVQPNMALAEKELDANFFQHVPYLEQFAAEKRLDLTWVAKVHVEPMGVYSEKIKAIEELRDGAVIGIPNDPTNSGRALLLLQHLGLITLKENAGLQATVVDIASNPKKLTFRELEAAQLPRVLPDVDAAIINTNFALEAKLDPLTDAIAIEDAESPYANVLAVRVGDKDDPAIQKLVKALQSSTVREFILDKYQGAVVPAF